MADNRLVGSAASSCSAKGDERHLRADEGRAVRALLADPLVPGFIKDRARALLRGSTIQASSYRLADGSSNGPSSSDERS